MKSKDSTESIRAYYFNCGLGDMPPIPKIKNIHSKVYRAAKRKGALDMGLFHGCETTHCRAGWVIHLAGKTGYALEKFCGPALAAILIYRESGYEIDREMFYCNEFYALDDMKRLAEQEGKS